MNNRQKYRKKADRSVVAIRLDLDLTGFTYWKWGAEQRCSKGDWLVDNDCDIYTVNADVFDRTYRKIGRGTYVKVMPVWAEVAASPGVVSTKEGESHYQAGDYLVCNNEDGTDAYSVSAEKFEAMYELDE